MTKDKRLFSILLFTEVLNTLKIFRKKLVGTRLKKMSKGCLLVAHTYAITVNDLMKSLKIY